VRLQISLAGDVQLDRQLLRFADRTDDMTAPFTAIAADLTKVEKSQFRTQGRYSGGWEALSPRYAARKARKYPGAKILHADGTLEASLTRDGARGAVREITRDSLTYGTTVEYAKYHQLGTSVMPRRRPLELTANKRRQYTRALLRYLTTGEVTANGKATS